MNHKTNPNGFTLVEVLVALFVMLIAFVAVWGLHFSSLSVDINNKLEATALDRANTCIEKLRANSFALLSSGNDNSNPSFPVSWVVTTPYPSEPGLRNVDLTVTWTERNKNFGGARTSQTRSLRISTVFANL